jgi:hypothetical protein
MAGLPEFAQVVPSYGCTPSALYRLCLVLYSPSKARWDTTLLNSLVNVYPMRLGSVLIFCSLQIVWQHLPFLHPLLERCSNVLAFGC